MEKTPEEKIVHLEGLIRSFVKLVVKSNQVILKAHFKDEDHLEVAKLLQIYSGVQDTYILGAADVSEG